MLCSAPKGGEVVVKAMSKHTVRQDWVDNEARAGNILKNKALVKYRESFDDDHFNYIVLDTIKGEDLWQFMNSRGWAPLSEKEAKGIFTQVLRSVELCHEAGIAHKDVKLENVMINKKWKTTLIDFGFCEFVEPNQLSKRFDGTLDYMPPEMLLRQEFNPFKADVFALGIFLYILLVGCFPWDLKRRCRIISNGGMPTVDWSMPGTPANLSVSVKNLIEKMLEPQPSERTSLPGVSTHPWVKPKTGFNLNFWQVLPTKSS